MAIWPTMEGHRMADSEASTSFARIAWGAYAHPMRNPGANILEKEPR